MSTSAGDRTWVMTGAAGSIGAHLRPRIGAQVACLRLVDVQPLSPEHAGEEVVRADLRDADAVAAALGGADGVIHLGAIPSEAPFPALVETNILGTFNVLEGARRAGVSRVVNASSNHATGLYPARARVSAAMPVAPDGLYGVSKAAGEALCSMYADKFGLIVTSVRIGSFAPAPCEVRHLSTWLSPEDCVAAFQAAMNRTEAGHAVFYGVSDNQRGWWDLEAGRRLGYAPADDAEGHAGSLAAQEPIDADEPQGGHYASPEFTLEYLDGSVQEPGS